MLTAFNQKDERWKDLKISGTDLTLEKAGCLIVSLSMLDGRTPDMILNLLNKANAFTDKGKLYWMVAAKVLNFIFDGIANKLPSITYLPVICETDHFKDRGYPQHFFVLLDGKLCLDPLDSLEKDNPYNIVSYRLIRKKPDLYPARPPDVEARAAIDMPPPRPTFLDRIARVVTSGCKT